MSKTQGFEPQTLNFRVHRDSTGIIETIGATNKAFETRRTDLPNRTPCLQVSKTCFGRDARLLGGRHGTSRRRIRRESGSQPQSKRPNAQMTVAANPSASRSVLGEDATVLNYVGGPPEYPQHVPQGNLVRRQNRPAQILFQSMDDSNGTKTIPTYENSFRLARCIRPYPVIHLCRRYLREWPGRCHPRATDHVKPLGPEIIHSLRIYLFAKPWGMNQRYPVRCQKAESLRSCLAGENY